ncbi:hypothetical protein EMPG_17178 [Blastomyces silverae]|uniref:F-box domain-containing protein n=1 Tax=Blastomyces silverae TaxID=2060906 RepID=A0A0H1B7E1_9EURO|nr:hypothetical protein EMPG_17178 [Blastomyces silverae]
MNPASTSPSSCPSHDFIPAYKALPTTHARQQRLQSLVQQLSNEDCHIVSNLIHARLHVDILGCLPLELAAGIASYLAPWDIFRYRLVSKRWNEVLSSPSVCSSSFRTYFPPEREQLSLLFDTSNPDWSRRFRQVTKQRLALVTGRPYSMSLFPHKGRRLENMGIPCMVSYHDGMIAHDLDARTIGLLSVVDGPIATYQAENRERFHKVALSCTAVAAVTIQGYCHVWNYKTGDEGSFRLPSKAICLVLDEDAVAVQVGIQPTVIITWDLRSRQAREIKHNTSLLLHIFLSARDSSLVLVHSADDEDGTPQNCNVDTEISGIVGTRYLLQGAVPALQDVTTYLKVPPNEPKIIRRGARAFRKYDRCVLAFAQFERDEDDRSDGNPWAYGRRRKYELVIPHPGKHQHQQQQQQDPRRPYTTLYHDLILQFMDYYFPSSAAHTCPDVLYYRDTVLGLTVANYQPGPTAAGATFAKSEIDDDEYVKAGVSPLLRDNFFMDGDDRFLVIVNQYGVNVWCFDEDVALQSEVHARTELRAKVWCSASAACFKCYSRRSEFLNEHRLLYGESDIHLAQAAPQIMAMSHSEKAMIPPSRVDNEDQNFKDDVGRLARRLTRASSTMIHQEIRAYKQPRAGQPPRSQITNLQSARMGHQGPPAPLRGPTPYRPPIGFSVLPSSI